MNNLELAQKLLVDLNTLSLTGVKDWQTGVMMAQEIVSLKTALEEEERRKAEAAQAALEEKRRERERILREAAENGGDVIGGETIRINGDGTTEVLIP